MGVLPQKGHTTVMRTNILTKTIGTRFRSSQAPGLGLLAPAGVTTAREVGVGIIGVSSSGSDDLTMCEMIAHHCPFIGASTYRDGNVGGLYPLRDIGYIVRAIPVPT